jgi:hypothetical protein
MPLHHGFHTPFSLQEQHQHQHQQPEAMVYFLRSYYVLWIDVLLGK